MNSGDLKTYKCVKISKSNFFTIAMLSLHSMCSESKNQELNPQNLLVEIIKYGGGGVGACQYQDWGIWHN